MNKVIDNWVNNVKLYPPSEIFHNKYGKEAKAEERLKEICEELYFFASDSKKNYLSDLYSTYRDLEVLYIFGFDRVKPEYLNKVIENFSLQVKESLVELDKMFKKDNILSNYYSTWKVKYSDIKAELYNLTK